MPAMSVMPETLLRDVDAAARQADSVAGSRDPWLRVTAIAVAIALVLAFRAAFSAYFMLDDFGMLAIARFLDNPFEPFWHNHIPGGLYYRPLGMLFWWLSERALGTDAAAQYLVNLALHLVGAAALWRFTSKLCESQWAGILVAACFACHPIGFGTTLWLSDRFDLLALPLGFLGLHQVLEFSRSASSRAIWLALPLLSASLLSKEIALAFFVSSMMLCLCADRQIGWQARFRACAILCVPIAAYFLVRSVVLPNPSAESLFSIKQPLHLLADGLGHWATGGFDFLTCWQRLGGWKKGAAFAGVSVVVVLLLVSTTRPWSIRRKNAVLAGLSLCATTALLQWPLLGNFSVRISEASPVLDLVVNSRYFYASLAGFLIAIAGFLMPVLERWKGARIGIAFASALLVVPWLLSDQNLARRYRNETHKQQELVEAALASIGKSRLPATNCQIYLLDTQNWTFGWISDEAVKATYPDLARIESCLVQTEHTPWYHIARRDSIDPGGLRPMTLVRGQDESQSAQRIGRGRFLALNLDDDNGVPADSQALFLSWQTGRFVDVSAEVREGRRAPRFACNRRAEQCPK